MVARGLELARRIPRGLAERPVELRVAGTGAILGDMTKSPTRGVGWGGDVASERSGGAAGVARAGNNAYKLSSSATAHLPRHAPPEL